MSDVYKSTNRCDATFGKHDSGGITASGVLGWDQNFQISAKTHRLRSTSPCPVNENHRRHTKLAQARYPGTENCPSRETKKRGKQGNHTGETNHNALISSTVRAESTLVERGVRPVCNGGTSEKVQSLTWW